MDTLERLIRCAVNDRVAMELEESQGGARYSVETESEMMRLLNSLDEATIHFVLSAHRREQAFVVPWLQEDAVMDYSRGGWIEACLHPVA